jgi:electron transport complex protein RnfC
MSVTTFKRGLKIPTHKEATEGKHAVSVPIPKQVIIPINQHFGAPNKPIVAVGDVVKRGQKIADAASPGPMTVPVHASIAGVIKKIEVRTQTNNSEGPCIIIEGSGDEASWRDTAFMEPLDPFKCTKEEALARIREAGLIGMGGAGFPVHVKLSPPPGKTIDTIIADGAECEPYLTTDEAAIEAKTSSLIRGLAITMKITGVKKAIIGMEDNKASLVQVIEQKVKEAGFLSQLGFQADISVGLCRTRYPQGGEKMLITALTGREVPSGALPADAHCIVQNVGTLIAIAEAFEGRPLIERGLTVSGGACGNPMNLVAPIGTVLGDLPPEFLAINYGKLAKIIAGGPMMGFAIPGDSIPIQKNTSGMIFMTAGETSVVEEGPCIRCGRCVRNCPMKLFPVLMREGLDSGDLDEVSKIGLMDCIECGACTFICPARIKLVQRFRIGKAKLRNKMAADAAAAKAVAAAASGIQESPAQNERAKSPSEQK